MGRERGPQPTEEYMGYPVMEPAKYRGDEGFLGKIRTVGDVVFGPGLFPLMENIYTTHASKGDAWVEVLKGMYVPIHPLALKQTLIKTKLFDKQSLFARLNEIASEHDIPVSVTMPTDKDWQATHEVLQEGFDSDALRNRIPSWSKAIDFAFHQIDKLQQDPTIQEEGIDLFKLMEGNNAYGKNILTPRELGIQGEIPLEYQSSEGQSILEGMAYKFITRHLSSTTILNNEQQRTINNGINTAFNFIQHTKLASKGAAPFMNPYLYFRSRGPIKDVHKVGQDFIADYLKSPYDSTDLLAILALAEQDGKLQPGQVEGELTVMFVAGQETTTSALQSALFLLGQEKHRHILEKAIEEVDRVVGDREPTAEDLDQLDYIQAVFYETLRLFPPNWVFNREALTDDPTPPITDAKTGQLLVAPHRLKKGGKVLIPQFFAYKNEAFFERAQEFWPERFIGENGKTIRAAQLPGFHPFGLGPRSCAGEEMATIEGKLFIAKMLQKYRPILRSAPEEAKPVTGLTLHLEDVRLSFEERQDQKKRAA